ncbi:hypothetical protein C7B61_14785 [filamentous cyanobacterium CCP1]|nr:hypothetical protein C7B76_26755 [filamentous cyanobacterium CCP2]PSB62257.1 hypothetical protein C7B61_14785 [filamentous cyanobacterium CCP1]
MKKVFAYLRHQRRIEHRLYSPNQSNASNAQKHFAWLSTSIALSGIAGITLADVAIAQVPPSAQRDGFGMQGEERGESIAALQRQLANLGYYNGEITGYYGPQTQDAVIRFQQDMGLAPDGIVGPATSQALYQYGSSSGGARQPQSAGASLPTIQLNQSGEQVAELQRRLSDLGYYSGSITGNFDYSTEAAVMQFQRDNALTADGIVGSSTEEALRRPSSEIARPDAPATPANPSPTESDRSDGLLRLGDNGQIVSDLQLRLKELGFYQGEVTGVYGPETEAAVLAFQQSQGLLADGVVGPQVSSALYSFGGSTASNSPSTDNSTTSNIGGTSSSVPTAPNAAPSGTEMNPATAETPNPQVNNPQVNNPQEGAPQAIEPQNIPPQTLQQLEQAQAEAEQARLEAEQARLEAEQARMVLYQNVDEGRYSVSALQRQLQNQGFYPGDVTGVFSSDTQSAILEAQQNYGLTPSDLFNDGETSYPFPY